MFERLVWIVPVAMVVVAVVRPRAAVVALAAALPFFGASRGGPYQGALDVACVAAILASLRLPRPAWTQLDFAVLAFAGAGVFSFVPLAFHPPSWDPRVAAGLAHALANAQASSGLFTWRALLDLILGFGVYFATRSTFTGRSGRPLGLALAGGLAAVVLLGLAEHLGAIDLGGYRTVAAEGRLHALFSNSGWLGQYVVIACPLAAAALLSTGRLGPFAAALLLPLCLATLLLSHQRGAWLAVLAQCGLAIALLGRARWREPRVLRAVLALVVTSAVGAAVATALRPDVVAGFASRWTNPDLLQRPHLWRAAARLWLERPAGGWGIGTFEPALEQRAPVTAVPQSAHGEAHSTLLHVAAERGLVGLLGLGLLVVAAVASAREGLRHDADRPLAMARALALAGAATYALVQYVWYPPAVGLLVWMTLGIGPSFPTARGGNRLAARAALVVGVLSAVPGAWRVLGGDEPLRLPDDRSYGFHAQEPGKGRTFQWTEGRAARRLDCRGRWLFVELTNGHPRAARRPVQVTVLVDGRRLAVRDAPIRWQQWTVPIGDACDDGKAVVELLASPTFRPFSDFRRDPSLPASRDERELGIAVRDLRVE